MAIRTRNILSLCAGVGGLELGIALALHTRGEAARGICYLEREAGAAASLVASMEAGWLHPAPIWSDMCTFDARRWRGHVHILASGDPCQENSVAGKRAGAAGARFLAPEVVRIADECRPDLIVRENVPGNADGQLEAIVPSLERLGYIVAAGIFSSAETGNTMRRERLFIVAEPNDGQRGDRGQQRGGQLGLLAQGDGASRRADTLGRTESIGRREGRAEPTRQQGRHAIAVPIGAVDRANGIGRRAQGDQRGAPSDALQPGRRLPPAVIPGPTDSRWIDVLDRWPELQPALSQEETESHLRRGVDAMAHRIERLRATGNGVDPVVAAYAVLRLSALLAEARGSGKSFLMEQAA